MPNAPGAPFSLRLAYEGEPIVGVNDGDTLIWDVNRKQWRSGQPGASGTPPAIGADGTFLGSNGTSSYWTHRVDYLEAGNAPFATTGQIRGSVAGGQNFLIYARNPGNTGDTRLIGLSSSNILFIGSATAAEQPSTIEVRSAGAVRVFVPGQVCQFNAASILFGVQALNIDPSQVSPAISQVQATSGNGTDLAITAQSSITGNGGNLTLSGGGGSPGTNGNLGLAPSVGNIAELALPSVNFQSMVRGKFMGNVTTIPAANPAAGGFDYVNAGARTWRGSGGTVTVMGPP